MTVVEPERALAINRAGWNRVAPSFHGGTALPDGKQYVVTESCFAEGAREYTSWKGVPIVIHRRTLGTFIAEIVRAGFQLEALVEGAPNAELAMEQHLDPARWYSVPRAQLMPTTFIIKARKAQRQ
jgi:hypothetical protein